MSTYQDTFVSTPSLEGSETDFAISKVENGIVVPHEYVTKDPELASDAVGGSNTTNAGARALRDGAKVEGGRSDREGFTVNGEGYTRNGGAAWEGVDAISQGRGSIGRSRDLLVECLDTGCIPNDQSRSLQSSWSVKGEKK
jgi:hypothetical protein